MTNATLTADDLISLLELGIESYQQAMQCEARHLYIEGVTAQDRAERAIGRVIDAIRTRG